MAAHHQVICIISDGSRADQRIDGVGDVTSATNGGPWQLPIDEAITREDGTYQFYAHASLHGSLSERNPGHGR